MSYYGPGTNDLTFTPLKPQEEADLFKRFYAGDLAARDELIQKHLRLVAKLSIAFAKKAMPDDEAISAGNYGLMQALNSKRFKPEFRVLFSTYLRSWVQGEIRRALRLRGEHHPAVAAPGMWAEGATLTGHPQRMQVCAGKHTQEGAPHPMFEKIEEECAPSVADLYEEQQINEERRKSLDKALATLTPIERAVVIGIVNEEKNFTDLGKENKVSRQACTKAYNRALRKLREVLDGERSNLM